ncbi:serine hydrolase domain-containing protein [Psychroserpens ponticola]|uniref:Serine hydrolase n=1 Tax=Psychroserpens ponticola TaxID=2932268 RepID=A0ABY7RW66_9FLAO|nr:serine hydrolase [Psychroserpens ponticola]WCO00936.1 serine hydrolase [Psychroserpens ponticola]
MKPIAFTCLLNCFLLFFSCASEDNNTITEQDSDIETIYFPPNDSDVWETKTISEVAWNENQLAPLLDFLQEKNTKSFMLLHNGKIVVEAYMNGHTKSSPWYWASAGKTLTSTVSGIAQDEGLININSKASDYLGTGWTSATLEKENLITNRHLLSMSTGLDDSLGEDITPDALYYVADPETRWAYHNVFLKMQDVVALASNTSWDNYFNTKLKDKIGMSGSWIPFGSLNVYWSNTRSMARFGLMISAKGKWENDVIVSESFLNEAISTSQNINESYGYLWWLNGKSTYHLPQSQIEFPGNLIPNAPNDMYCALGKNDQKIYIIPSKNLVVIRMGEAAENSNFALSSFDDELWGKVNAFIN